MNAIETRKLTKRYGTLVALDALDLAVAQGEMLALLGVNGAGKSTAIKLLSCLTSPDGGEAYLGGYSIGTDAQRIKEIIGVSPQETAIAKKLSVRENLEFMAQIHGESKAQAAASATAMIEKMKLAEVADRRAGQLSGGWQRRISIALALISRPRILFLDEPTLGLDVIARHELWELIRELKGEVTVVLTTHYLEEAESLCDRIAILSGGRLTAIGTTSELMALAGCERFEDAFVKLCSKGVSG